VIDEWMKLVGKGEGRQGDTAGHQKAALLLACSHRWDKFRKAFVNQAGIRNSTQKQ